MGVVLYWNSFPVSANSISKGDKDMENGRIAIPSVGRGGLDGRRSDHFGHCEVFTLVDVEGGKIKRVTTLRNQDHGQGGCMVPVKSLTNSHANALIVGGIGRRPLEGFKQVGIDVYYDTRHTTVKPVVEDLIAGILPLMGLDQVCSGEHGNCSG